MYRLLYISTSPGPIEPATIGNILRVSRRNNARDGIGGLLVTGGRRFLQVLEGHRDPVERAYVRIADDPRHRAAVVLSRADDDRQLFSQWAMGHVAGAGDELADLVAAVPDPTLRAYFEGFVRQHAA